MEYQRIISLLINTPNQSSKFRTKTWVEINGDSPGTHNTNNQIEFKTSMSKSSLCDYSNAYKLVKGDITVAGAGADDTARDTYRNNKQAIFKNYAPFTDCIPQINNTQVDNARDLDVVMPLYNLIEYSDNYSKISGGLYQFCREMDHATIETCYYYRI